MPRKVKAMATQVRGATASPRKMRLKSAAKNGAVATITRALATEVWAKAKRKLRVLTVMLAAANRPAAPTARKAANPAPRLKKKTKATMPKACR